MGTKTFVDDNVILGLSSFVWYRKLNLDGFGGSVSYWHDLRKHARFFSRRQTKERLDMIRACFSVRGLSSVASISRNLNGEKYTEMLRNNLLPFFNDHHSNRYVIMQYEYSCHRANVTKVWLQQHNVQVLGWLACSLELNPIRNLWSTIFRSLYRHGKHYKSNEKFKNWNLKQWAKIEQQTLVNLAQLLSKFIAAVLQVWIKQTKY